MKVMLRVPVQDAVDKSTVRWLLWLQEQPEADTWDIDLHEAAGFGVANARNDILREFLTTDCTHVWMLDSDIAPPRKLHLLEGATDYPVLAGAYLGMTEVGLRWHMYHHLGDAGWAPLHPRKAPTTRWFKVDAAGTGCLLLQRGQVEALGPDPFAFERSPEGGWRGEDLLFGQKVGGLVVDTHYVCEHSRRVPLTRLWQHAIEDLCRQP